MRVVALKNVLYFCKDIADDMKIEGVSREMQFTFNEMTKQLTVSCTGRLPWWKAGCFSPRKPTTNRIRGKCVLIHGVQLMADFSESQNWLTRSIVLDK